jgi:hypothetical protein
LFTASVLRWRQKGARDGRGPPVAAADFGLSAPEIQTVLQIVPRHPRRWAKDGASSPLPKARKTPSGKAQVSRDYAARLAAPTFEPRGDADEDGSMRASSDDHRRAHDHELWRLEPSIHQRTGRRSEDHHQGRSAVAPSHPIDSPRKEHEQ